MSALAIAADLGGSHLTCALLREREIIASRSIETTNEPFSGVLKRLEAEIQTLPHGYGSCRPQRRRSSFVLRFVMSDTTRSNNRIDTV